MQNAHDTIELIIIIFDIIKILLMLIKDYKMKKENTGH